MFGSTIAAALLAAALARETDPCDLGSIAWVDAKWGSNVTGVVNDATKPYRTIQKAIDDVHANVQLRYNQGHGGAQGMVFVLPGIYGPTSPAGGLTDFFPIKMKDRVHVRGVGARRVILRGGIGTGSYTAYWPTITSPGLASKNVLVTYDRSQAAWSNAPWTDETEELLDGFTFIGGDVQVQLHTHGLLQYGVQLARISNCVFDLRHTVNTAGAEDAIAGAWFGILIAHEHDGAANSARTNVLNNTFVFAREGYDAAPDELARADAVGICDVVPADFSFPYPRGIGNHSVQNNLFRTFPGAAWTVTLGIDRSDTSASNLSGSLSNTNAFVAGATGGMNGSFWSNLALGQVASIPAVDLANADPGFVGEMLVSQYGVPPTAARDWRLVPDSVLKEQGFKPVQYFTSEPLKIISGCNRVYVEPHCIDLSSFQWDGEHFGNPRVSGNQVDIGFDEIHMLTMAGDWGNDSNSHNLPAAPLSQYATPGLSTRRMIVPAALFTAGSTGTIDGSLVQPPTRPIGWVSQPGTTQVTLGAPFAAGFNVRYYDNTKPPGPTPFTATFGSVFWIDPRGGNHTFLVSSWTDNEGTGISNYFNAQATITIPGSSSFISNLQQEYR